MDNKSHRSNDISTEHDWNSCDTSSVTNDYCVTQQILYYQPAPYDERQQYRHDRTSHNVPSRNMHNRGKVENQSSINSGIPTPYIKHVPVVTLGTEHQYIYIYISNTFF